MLTSVTSDGDMCHITLIQEEESLNYRMLIHVWIYRWSVKYDRPLNIVFLGSMCDQTHLDATDGFFPIKTLKRNVRL
jgi:hypothetical protein